MSEDITDNSCVLSSSQSTSPVHDEDTTTADGGCSPQSSQPNDAQGQGEDKRTNAIGTTPNDSKSQCSPCLSGEQPSPPQLHRPPSPSSPSLPHSNSLSHSFLHTKNSSGGARHRHQRRDAHPKVKGKKPPRRLAAGKNSQNRKLTEFYQIRRSSRKSKTELKCELKKHIDDLITKGIEEGMEERKVEGKGRAVFATRPFQKGEYVVEYHGELLQITDAKKKEAEYAQNPATGCYMYYFQYLCKTYCVDATKETGRKGRLINHSKNGNCQTKLHDINGVPHLILVASRDIDEGEELLYDYGDRSKASIAAHPWLKY
ncbi:N-lysine methyltransferase KMT5A-A-like isoform X2 [Mastacembelus armatus]|uniref:N-lysine methyltransferase KMT5A-A-like isoform X2 n=1 Tax=Mastacembelus armatus TaxID=205130 RepID=UPI000E463D2F|nr:N-lysine methyltransferase KMT5A-A-like isoform X2 [Mastacembelus armatus]